MTDHSNSNVEVKIQAAILEALGQCATAVSVTALAEIADPREVLGMSVEDVDQGVRTLFVMGLVKCEIDRCSSANLWSITTKGRAHLIAGEVESVASDCRGAARPEPGQPRIHATVCDAVEPKEPATALICLAEDELDAWWADLDVECKADAFAQFALHMHSGEHSYVHVEESRSVPVLGTVGETAAEWNAKAQRLNANLVARQPDPACIANQEMHGEQGYYE